MILDKIVEQKRKTLAQDKYHFSIESFLETKREKSQESFRTALKKQGLSIIGEIKKASPSKGLIREDFCPIALAKEYEKAVECISVLTEETFFQGSPDYLKQVHQVVATPLLCKDFIISPLQILEACQLGASAILLITAILDDTTLHEFLKLAHGLHLDALVEVHDKQELERALQAGADIIGINNRNLMDFSENINTTLHLSKLVPKEVVIVSESSIHTTEDIALLKEANIDAVLIGESFMRCNDIRKKAKELKEAFEG